MGSVHIIFKYFGDCHLGRWLESGADLKKNRGGESCFVNNKGVGWLCLPDAEDSVVALALPYSTDLPASEWHTADRWGGVYPTLWEKVEIKNK